MILWISLIFIDVHGFQGFLVDLVSWVLQHPKEQPAAPVWLGAFQ